MNVVPHSHAHTRVIKNKKNSYFQKAKQHRAWLKCGWESLQTTEENAGNQSCGRRVKRSVSARTTIAVKRNHYHGNPSKGKNLIRVAYNSEGQSIIIMVDMAACGRHAAGEAADCPVSCRQQEVV